MSNEYFIPETPEHHPWWDGTIALGSVPDKLDWKKLLAPLPCGAGVIDAGFEFNGSSSGIFRFLIPKWRHPIASCRHDYRCILIRQLRNEGMDKHLGSSLRKQADKLFREDIHIGQSGFRASFESFTGYVGVRIGALFGIGS